MKAFYWMAALAIISAGFLGACSQKSADQTNANTDSPPPEQVTTEAPQTTDAITEAVTEAANQVATMTAEEAAAAEEAINEAVENADKVAQELEEAAAKAAAAEEAALKSGIDPRTLKE